jgi:hypothetical protein
MIKRLMLLLVLVCVAFSQVSLVLPPYVLGEHISVSKSHGNKLIHSYSRQVTGLEISDYRVVDGDLRYDLQYHNKSLVKVKCRVLNLGEEAEEWYNEFGATAEEEFGVKGKEIEAGSQYPGYISYWSTDMVHYSVRWYINKYYPTYGIPDCIEIELKGTEAFKMLYQ